MKTFIAIVNVRFFFSDDHAIMPATAHYVAKLQSTSNSIQCFLSLQWLHRTKGVYIFSPFLMPLTVSTCGPWVHNHQWAMLAVAFRALMTKMIMVVLIPIVISWGLVFVTWVGIDNVPWGIGGGVPRTGNRRKRTIIDGVNPPQSRATWLGRRILWLRHSSRTWSAYLSCYNSMSRNKRKRGRSVRNTSGKALEWQSTKGTVDGGIRLIFSEGKV